MALYYSILKYQKENYTFLNNAFTVIELVSPNDDRNDILNEVEILFAPLGFYVGREKIDSCKNLKVIVSNTTGIPHIDISYAKSKNISVCALHDEQAFLRTITPTAEHTIGLIFALYRKLLSAHNTVLQYSWNRNDFVAPKMLSRLCCGIVGYGRLGSMVGMILRAMGSQVIYYDPYIEGGEVTLEALACKSNILTIHAPANPSTTHLISRKILQFLPKGAIVINTARGELLDHDALLELIETGHIGGAALDTLPGEYSDAFTDTPFFKKIVNFARNHENLLLTPHIGGSTSDARSETELFVLQKALNVMKERAIA